jgi:hypothetical protein
MYQQSGDPAQSAQVITLDTHNWTPGMYLLHWQDQQETRSVKIIKI